MRNDDTALQNVECHESYFFTIMLGLYHLNINSPKCKDINNISFELITKLLSIRLHLSQLAKMKMEILNDSLSRGSIIHQVTFKNRLEALHQLTRHENCLFTAVFHRRVNIMRND